MLFRSRFGLTFVGHLALPNSLLLVIGAVNQRTAIQVTDSLPLRGPEVNVVDRAANRASASAGGPLYYVGREMKLSHRGLGINERDWQVFLGHVNATLDHFKVPSQEKSEVLGFVESLKKDIVE